MKSPEVTVVVPVYNVEKYLEQCIESILNQSFPDFELILVDDGSTDGSLDIERRYSAQNRRVKLIEKEHSNAGEARNLGLEQAAGRYITFLDSDDYYEKDLLKKEYMQLEKDKADICACNGDHYNEQTGEYESVEYFLIRKYIPEYIPFCLEDCPDYIFQVIATGPWLRMYRVDFIKGNGLRYQSVVRGNDVFFSNMALALAKRITVVDDVLVHHRIGLKQNLQSGLCDTPDIYLDLELNWKTELERRNLFEKCHKSFGLYVLNNLRAHFSKNDERIQRKLKERIKGGVLGELGFVDYIEEKTKEYIMNPELYGVWEEAGWLDFARMMLAWEFPEKSRTLVSLIDDMDRNRKIVDEGGREFGVYDLFPFEFIPKGSRVIIYGLGKIGRGYIKQIKTSHWCKIVGVSDKEKSNNVYCYHFYEVKEMHGVQEYDYVIVSIANQEVARSVKDEMLSEGICEDKVFCVGNKRYELILV